MTDALELAGQLPCKWGGGNDYLACQTCGLEYDYRVGPRPPCGAAVMLRTLQEERDGWEANAREMLKGDKDVVRMHEGGGPESLVGSLAITMLKTRKARDAAEADLAAQAQEIAALREALNESYSTFAAAFNRIHSLPRTSDTDLARRIGETRAKIERARSLAQGETT